MNNLILIAITETRERLKDSTNISLEKRLKKAMQYTCNHWLVTQEEDQFQAAVRAVMLECSNEEKQWIEKELKILNGIAAAISGVPVDMVKLMNGIKEEDFIGLKKLWDETKPVPEQ